MLEPGGELGTEHLEGDGAVVPQIMGEEHGGHAAGAELALDPVAVGDAGLKPVAQFGHQAPDEEWSVGRNRGAFRCNVTCSNAYASRISVGSAHARPMNERLTGRPHAWPIGTLMLGYPATAAGVLLPPVK